MTGRKKKRETAHQNLKKNYKKYKKKLKEKTVILLKGRKR
jgi:hypothetical protein